MNQAAQTRSRRSAVRRKHGERGFTLPLLAICLFVMVGMLGLAIDLGKIFITKNELQTFADASALAALMQMDGTQSGIQGANVTAVAGPLGTAQPNGYNLDTIKITNVTATYATDFGGTYDSYATASSSASNSYRFINVIATVSVPLNFLPVIHGIPSSMSFSASTVAGQQAQSSMSQGGLLPFAPDAHDAADTKNFGLTPGTEYSLKWGNGNSTTCAGDLGFTPPGSPPSEHGFVDIGEGNGTSGIRPAIEYGGFPNADSTPSSLSMGDTLGGDPGNRGSSIFGAMSNRAAQDTDDTSTTYAQYKALGTGNGRRVVTVAVGGAWSGNGHNAHTTIVGFANFFLDAAYSGTSGPICATYIGPANSDGNGSGGTDGTKIYTNVLYK